MPRDGSSGVEAIFHTATRPSLSSNMQMSVKVPPASTPTRQRAILLTRHPGEHRRPSAAVLYVKRTPTRSVRYGAFARDRLEGWPRAPNLPPSFEATARLRERSPQDDVE